MEPFPRRAIWVCVLVLAGCGFGASPLSGVTLPSDPNATPLLWTSQVQPDRWQALLLAIGVPTPEGFRANVRLMTDPALNGLSDPDIRRLPRAANASSFVLVADGRALFDEDFPIKVLDLSGENLPSFRVVARCLWAVENNLAIANVSWEELIVLTDADGVLRDC